MTEEARTLLWSRGISDAQIDMYSIGVMDQLPRYQYSSAFADWYRNNEWQLRDVWVFPLTSPQGKIRGFQFRKVDRAKKGYLDYFVDKAEPAFFGLGQAMPGVWESESIWLTEGVFDHCPIQRQRPDSIPTLHAGISDTLWRFLQRMVRTIYLAYDMDSAGVNGSYKILQDNREQGSVFNIEIVKFPRVSYRGRIATDPSDLWEAWGDSQLGEFIMKEKWRKV